MAEKVDKSLAHPHMMGVFHYHSASTCIADEGIHDDMRPMTRNGDIMTEIREAYAKLPYRSVFGIAKDGRLIYTPFYDNGKTYQDCDVDVCNVMEIVVNTLTCDRFPLLCDLMLWQRR